MGEFARGGMTRGAHQACEHDLGGREKSIPCGSVEADSGAGRLTVGRAYNTSDFIVATLAAKGQAMDAPAQAAGEL